MGKIFGIDLGTTYSSIVYIDEYGKPVTVMNPDDDSPVTPSVVYFDPDIEPVVGNPAKSMLLENPKLVCSAIKRVMGSDTYTFSANGKTYRPQEVSAYILKQLAANAFSILGEKVEDVVITCPAYFGEQQREATKDAGKIAGLNVLSILNEPTAAAIAYGLKVDEPQTVIVYDLGGGTFDVTVIKVSEGNIDVIATDGDHMLGGRDWDAKIRDYVIDQYVQMSGQSKDEVMDDPEAMGDLELKSEEVKRKLSSLPSYTVRLLGKKILITREQFDNITEGLLNNTMDMMKRTMEEAAKKKVTHYDKILLVGGSTFMPQVRERLKKEYPNIPIVVNDPNQSVARGAALYGANLQTYKNVIRILNEKGIIDPHETDKDEIRKIIDQNRDNLDLGEGFTLPPVINNVISKSIGCKLLDQKTGEIKIFNLIFKNTTVPCFYSKVYPTSHANQQKVQLSIYEDDYPENFKPENVVDEKDATLLTDGFLEPLPPNLPEGSPIELKIKIDNEGLLSVDATDMSRPNGVTVHMVVDIKGAMSEEEIKKARQEVLGH